jgi:CheY-like chemotaxis protein
MLQPIQVAVVLAGGFSFGAASLTSDSTVTVGCALGVISATIGTAWVSGRKWQSHLDRMDAMEKRQDHFDDKLNQLIRERRFERDLPTPVPTTKELSVLLVDDDHHDRQMFRHSLGSMFILDEAESLAEAIDKAREKHYDCIVLDLYLRDSAPEDTVAMFLSQNPTAVCVALSGTKSDKHINTAIKQGADSFIAKGVFDRGYLSRMISLAISRKSME